MLSKTNVPGPTNILCLDGDGIGPEITLATRSVLMAVDRRFDLNLTFQIAEIGLKALANSGSTFPDEVLALAKRSDGILIGPVSTNDYPAPSEGGINPSGLLRKELDLYANIRPAKSFDGLPLRVGDKIDLVIARENTEGFYSDRSMFLGRAEFMPTEDMALSVRKITREASTRIAQTAFELAAKRRRKVTAVHKANVFRVSDGLFLDAVRAVRNQFPDFEYEEQIVDAMAALLIRDPSQFDVVVTTNMYGDILSDEASEIAGSLGMAASLNSGENFAMAQAQHGSAPSLAGLNIANPSSLVGSAAMLLRWIGKRKNTINFYNAADAIDYAIATAVKNPSTRTSDLGGEIGTVAYTEGLIKTIINS
ncbi:isocitrate/isopropylmalate family dehydrogenase [Candidatus Puniceispirillum sp.]|nr:isocitrate/isopropylmalate family dehydrogenase [Candidatus Puniceispirillum sp.]